MKASAGASFLSTGQATLGDTWQNKDKDCDGGGVYVRVPDSRGLHAREGFACGEASLYK